MSGYWQALERYTKDGRPEIDDNRSERAIRALTIGRENWLVLGSFKGGQGRRRAQAIRRSG